MTGSLRSTARNPVAIALMGMLILVFLILGVGGGGRFPDAFRGARADSVITAGGHATSVADFRRVFQNEKQHLEEQNKQTFTNEFLVENGLDKELLSEIALDDAQVEMLGRAGVVPDATLVDAQIQQIPVAFDRVTGKFSERQFTEFLASQGLTPRQVQTDFADQLAERHFALAVASGFKAPRVYAALSAIAGLQNRDVSYFVLEPKAVVQPLPPSDAQLQDYVKRHAAQWTRPEMRVISLARFSAAAEAPTVTVSDADIQKEFDTRKASLSTPETRTIVQIPVKTAAQGQEAAQRLAKGDDPAAIAHAFGAEPVTYDNRPRTAIADGKLAAAAFGMTEGQVAGPVQGDLGLAALKVTRITAATTPTLAGTRAKIEADLKTKAAQNKAYELSQKFDDARQAGASVVNAAQKAGAPAVTVGPFTATGADGLGKPVPGMNDKLAKAVFALRAGEDSDIQDAGPGEYYAFKVDKVIAPAVPPLDEIRPVLTQAYMQEQLVNALRAKADTLMAQIKQGKSMDEVAAGVGAIVTHQQGLQVIRAQQYQALGRDFLVQVFGQKPGAIFDAGAPNGVFIARLDAVRPGDPAQTAQFLQAIQPRVSQDYLRDLVASTKTAAEKAVKVNVNLALARKALNVDAASLGKEAKGAGGGK
ncbi:MAG TPA: peptidyl-prolyl cis-trans isomerase [Caulobacteraceae bacterium]|nr:peptidyl-prolyl cis-trans isomerase [Caulobacteraceae bacterium]